MGLLLASLNLHKVREIRAILRDFFPGDYLSLLNYPDYTLDQEVGTSFSERAVLQSVHAAKALDQWVLVDSSGLVVPALNNEPGLHSSNYAGSEATEKEHQQKLIDKLLELPEEERTGYFVCSLALASPEGLHKQVEASCEGFLLTSPRGSGGFGFDSLFVKNDYHQTFAEMDEATKNRVSHRRKALDKLLPALKSLLAVTC